MAKQASRVRIVVEQKGLVSLLSSAFTPRICQCLLGLVPLLTFAFFVGLADSASARATQPGYAVQSPQAFYQSAVDSPVRGDALCAAPEAPLPAKLARALVEFEDTELDAGIHALPCDRKRLVPDLPPLSSRDTHGASAQRRTPWCIALVHPRAPPPRNS